MEHQNGAGMPYMNFNPQMLAMGPPPFPLPNQNHEDGAHLKFIEDMFEFKSLKLQNKCSEELLTGLSSIKGAIKDALKTHSNSSAEGIEKLQLEITLLRESIGKDIFEAACKTQEQITIFKAEILEEFQCFKRSITEDFNLFKSSYPASAKEDSASSKPVNKVACVKPSSQASCSAKRPATSEDDLSPDDIEPYYTVSSSDEEIAASLSDIEVGVFGKSLATAKRALPDNDGPEASDPDSDFAPRQSKAGRKRESRNRGKTKKELQEELEKLRREKKALAFAKIPAVEPSFRKSSRL